MATLEQWFGGRDLIRRLYGEELGRDIVGDPDALTNWLYHWREGPRDEAWIRARIRESPEWQANHGSSPLPPMGGPPAPPAPIPDPPVVPGAGGFYEGAGDPSVRPSLPVGFRLPGRGVFTFPPPYNTRAFRLTNKPDGEIRPAGYSYWAMVSLQVGGARLLAFAGRGDHPIFFSVDLGSGTVEALGELLPMATSGEQCYWDPLRRSCLYCPVGGQLLRIDVASGQQEVVVDLGPTRPGALLWQPHSSRDGQVHSYTIRNGQDPWNDLAVGVSRYGHPMEFPFQGAYDECQIDATGRYLLVKETVSRGGRDHLDNWVHDLVTGITTHLLDEDGAVGHSDMGAACMVGEDDSGDIWRLVRWDLETGTKQVCYEGIPGGASSGAWGNGLGHVSVVGDSALISNTGPALPRVNELIRVRLDGSLQAQVLAPNLMATTGAQIPYDLQVKANLDATGRFAAWTANPEGRLDLFVLQLP